MPEPQLVLCITRADLHQLYNPRRIILTVQRTYARNLRLLNSTRGPKTDIKPFWSLVLD